MLPSFLKRQQSGPFAADGVLLDQRRRRPRRAVIGQGIVVDSAGASCVGVVIKDLSDTGARVYSTKADTVRDCSYLIDYHTGKAHLTSIVWRSSTELGLSFDRSFMLDGSTPHHLLHLRNIWMENA